MTIVGGYTIRTNANIQKLTADWLHLYSQPFSGLTIHLDTLHRRAISWLKVRTYDHGHRGQTLSL